MSLKLISPLTMKKAITILILFGFLLPTFYFVQGANQSPNPPETLKEAEIVGGKVLRLLPGTLKGIWQEALEIWQIMGEKVKNFWNSYIWPWFQNIWHKILSSFGKEIKERKPVIEKEFKKEKEEMKTELPKVGKPLWERFKEIIK